MTLTAAERSRVERLHGVLRRQILDWDLENRPWIQVEILPLVERIRGGKTLCVAELARVCRGMGWEHGAFCTELGLSPVDYGGLIRLNDNVYFDAEFSRWGA